MPRLPHGEVSTFDGFLEARKDIREASEDTALGFAAARPIITRDFGFLFPELQDDPANLLPESRQTRDNLVELGKTMRDAGDGSSGDSDIPAVHTYLGQFVDHDITFETKSDELQDLTSEDLAPLGRDEVNEKLQNARVPTLNLDSVYGLQAPRDGARMKVGDVTRLNGTGKPRLRPPNKDDDHHDLPRKGRSEDEEQDRAACIGDPRNDENTIVAQLHVAFLRAHNALVDQLKAHGRAGKLPFGQARRLLVQYYQYIVLHDFLPKIADPEIVRATIERNLVYEPEEDEEDRRMPLEFSVAAYRFGHSMVRADYDFNLNFNTSGETGTFPATLRFLFAFSARSGQLGEELGLEEADTLPDNWIVEWENLVDVGDSFDRARRIDTKLVEPLFELRDFEGNVLMDSPEDRESGIRARLATRNLLRGYLLRMPTGQAVARVLREKLSGVRSIRVLQPAEIEQGAASEEQVQALRNGGFLERTPLWYYILAEAAFFGGNRLGPVGSTIVAEVLVGLIRRSPYSVLRRKDGQPPKLPSGQPGPSTLAELLRLAGVVLGAPPIRQGQPLS